MKYLFGHNTAPSPRGLDRIIGLGCNSLFLSSRGRNSPHATPTSTSNSLQLPPRQHHGIHIKSQIASFLWVFLPSVYLMETNAHQGPGIAATRPGDDAAAFHKFDSYPWTRDRSFLVSHHPSPIIRSPTKLEFSCATWNPH